MFNDLPAQTDPVFPILVCGVLGGVAVWFIQKQVRRRRLMKLGWTADDLRSQEQFFKKLGELTVAKLPEKVSFQEIPSHSWSNPSEYERTRASFESLGFRRNAVFLASPMDWVAEFWLSGEPALFAKIIDTEERGVYSEVTVIKSDGSPVSFENTEDCGFRHQEPDGWSHCGLITPEQLVEISLPYRQSRDVKPMNLAECVSAYERSVNEYYAWRRSVGISAGEMRQFYQRRKKRRSHS